MTPSRLDELEKFYAAFFPGDDKHVVMYSREMCYLFRVARAAVGMRGMVCGVCAEFEDHGKRPGCAKEQPTDCHVVLAFDAAIKDGEK